nr:retrovirus-related Pol polyprotein from transposon TNT 1-94 [Tanacetum cinerariifolium]
MYHLHSVSSCSRFLCSSSVITPTACANPFRFVSVVPGRLPTSLSCIISTIYPKSLSIFLIEEACAIKDSLTSSDKNLDLSAFKLSSLFLVSCLQGLLVVGDRMGLRCSAMSFFNFMLNLAFLVKKISYLGPLMTMLLTNRLSGRVRLHYNPRILIAGSSSMCFLFLLEDLNEVGSGIGAGIAEGIPSSLGIFLILLYLRLREFIKFFLLWNNLPHLIQIRNTKVTKSISIMDIKGSTVSASVNYYNNCLGFLLNFDISDFLWFQSVADGLYVVIIFVLLEFKRFSDFLSVFPLEDFMFSILSFFKFPTCVGNDCLFWMNPKLFCFFSNHLDYLRLVYCIQPCFFLSFLDLFFLVYVCLNLLSSSPSVRDERSSVAVLGSFSPSTFVGITNNGTEFVNQTLREYYEKVGISHETSVACFSQQNGLVERRNYTLIEAARTMLIYAKAPLFLWAKAVAAACYTQISSIIRLHHGKTPYELLHEKLPDLSFFHAFGALCYPKNNTENLGKLQPKADIGIFIGYTSTKKAFQIYNRHTRRIIKTINVYFDELTAMASEHSSLEPILHELTLAKISSELVPNPPPSTSIPILENDYESSSSNVIPTIVHTAAPNSEHITKWTKDHPLNNIIGELERHISTKLQLYEQALFCYYDAFLRSVEPKNYKDALTQACWIEAMQEELNEFDHLEVWELVPRPNKVMVITLKWIYKETLVSKGFFYTLTAYADVDHTGFQDSRRSTSGSMKLLGDNLVSWSLKRQKALRYPVRKLHILPCLAIVLKF